MTLPFGPMRQAVIVGGSQRLYDSLGQQSVAPGPDPNVVASVTLSPSVLSLVENVGVQLVTAVPRNSGGSILGGKTATWVSSNPTVATVASTGDTVATVTGVAAGTTTVTATIDGVGGIVTVTVLAAVATVTLNPSTTALEVPNTQVVIADVLDSGGAPLTGRDINWSSSDSGVASVTPGSGYSATITAAAAGTATITATVEGVSGTTVATITSVSAGLQTIQLDPGTTFQTMQGWEATAQIGQSEYNSLWSWSGADFKDVQTELLDLTVNELGIDRVRLEIHPRFENDTDYYTQWQNGTITRAQWKAQWGIPVNDNADPNTINVAGYQFTELDDWIVECVNPMRVLATSNGERIYVNLCYTDFTLNNHFLKTTPAEYAELVLASFNHINTNYGWVPDAVELVLESDLASYSGTTLGNYVVATEAALTGAGYTGVEYIAPSVTNVANALSQISSMNAVSGAQALITEYSYHRYNNPSVSNIRAIANRAAIDGKRTSHLEWIGASYTQLMEDLVDGNVSAWSQFTIAWYDSTGSDDGGKYYIVDDSNINGLVVRQGFRTRYLVQFMRHVRLGAVRIQATVSDGSITPFAWINANGKYTVVAEYSAGGGTLEVADLPTGTYGRSYSTSSAQNTTQSDVGLTAGELLTMTIPASGVLTVWQK